MPILKKLPGRSKSCHEFPRVNGELILPRLDLDIRDLNELKDLKELNELKDLNKNLNPFEDVDLDDDDDRNRGDMGLIMGEVKGNLQLKSSCDGEEEENEVNAGKHGAGNPKVKPLRGTLERICGVSPLKTLGKLGKGLRISGRSVWGNSTPHYSPGDSNTLPAEKEKRKGVRRSSEGIMTLLRFTGRRKEERRESLPCGDLSVGNEVETSRRSSFLRMVSLGKLKRESMSDKASQETEEEMEEAEDPVVKTREPLSVLEILQLVNHRDLLLADTHIQELERECELLSLLPNTTPPTLTPTLCPSTPPSMLSLSSSFDESLSSNATLDSSRRKAKDVELLYEALQKEMWDVVRESLRQPSAGPNLGLVVLVIQQEEHADAAWALREETKPEQEVPRIQPSQRPRRLKMKWRQAVAEAADWSLPHQVDTQAGQLASYLERLKCRMVDDLDAARRNAISIYPEEFAAFQVYVESYHRAVAKRLHTITSGPLQITDVYSLLDWFYNIYNRDVLGTIGTTTPINYSTLDGILPQETVDRLEQDCISVVRDKVTTELIHVLDEEERRWAQTLHIEEYQSHLACSVIQRVKVDLDRSTSVNQFLGARVARCSLIGLADFIYSFQRKVEMFHDSQAEFGDRGDGYVSRTIALVNCCPPLRSFVDRCRQCDPQGSEESAQKANSSLDRIINQSVRVLTDRLFDHIRPFFDKLMKRKWLNNTEAFEAIEASIKQHFKKFRRMDSPPYQTLVGEVHRRVLVEYVRAIMRGRLMCTSSKMRKRMAFRLQDEAKQLKGLFKDLESSSSWLDSIICHLADIILLEDTPSIQMEVAVLVKEFPDIRKKHVSTLLNVRGMMRQAERQEILNVVKDFECSSALMCRDHALFSDIPITSEVHCISLGFLRLAMTVSNWFSEHRPRRRGRVSIRNATPQPAENKEDASKLHRED
ncbi:tumor necrosis factor alpha-induced protein 2-like [Neolamprologus brichardi]|uniref:tumor necrosis factor alpha-induced protein 2-like n=1 Tax=Neolamprologus brichardi TaxID=32507 RepID=UPI0003EBCCD9|nr:tumor necrosis factor alpha-induced protein 2-like [Neolamprologus brichardi]